MATLTEASDDISDNIDKEQINDENEDEDDDNELLSCESELSSFAMAALAEFRLENKIEEEDTSNIPKEDFGMSQFWWDDESSDMLAREAFSAPLPTQTAASEDEKDFPRRVCLMSSPSIWYAVERLKKSEDGFNLDATVLDIDPFVMYDYTNDLTEIPKELHGQFDYLVCAPPYMSTECVDKYLAAMDILAKHSKTPRAFVISSILEEAMIERGFK
eukprot:CAMPEP_0114374686 /NCGR_PEP_ID=MMETSP0101-20121206/35810_1 /TAXON_ID=38822 ORGANISM="Pteridomonas danica, Strain PT" /NCGR_SAMPLE_ID=MMETSP0101 /ASSEMBLY_ACC=CAM_ASM_000211 /LENGTH=216 /DNA_ID=CAMNT_0001528567 /DNA_START=32 /DNA_END=679 /DNA_ORIENTATION=+